jgi:hypothetical protein
MRQVPSLPDRTHQLQHQFVPPDDLSLGADEQRLLRWARAAGWCARLDNDIVKSRGCRAPTAATPKLYRSFIMAKSRNLDNRLTARKGSPTLLCAIGFTALTLVYLMTLGVLAAIGMTHPAPEFHGILVMVLALGSAASCGYLGGWAAVKGQLPLPWANHHPIAFGVGGGIAVLVLILLLGWLLLSTTASRHWCDHRNVVLGWRPYFSTHPTIRFETANNFR